MREKNQNKKIYKFGSFQLDPNEHTLSLNNEVISLTPKVFDTLLILVENNGHLVEKDELLEKVWSDSIVEEANLAKNISILRKVLSQNGLETPIIETVPKRGYRFIIPVKEISISTSPPKEKPSKLKTTFKDSRLILGVGVVVLAAALIGFGYWYLASEKRQIESIAVMPFVNESGNEDLEYLSDGMTETLIGNLTNISDLSVKARNTVYYYKDKNKTPKEIGKELNVDAVLLGRVAQRGENLKLNLELVDTKTLNAIWSETYNRKMSDLVSLQNEIAKNVSDNFKLKLTGKNQLDKTSTLNNEAYQAYLKGRFHWNKRTGDGFKRGIEFFQKAIELDPNYALAWSGLADSYSLLPNYGIKPIPEVLPKAQSAAEKAVALAPNLAESRTSLGKVLQMKKDFIGAEKEFQKAIQLNPKYPTAHLWYGAALSVSGKTETAVKEMKIALELDPLSLVINYSLGDWLYFARKYDEATKHYKKALELFPNNYRLHSALAHLLAMEGKLNEALSECEKAIKSLKDSNPSRLCFAGVYASVGKKSEAYKILEEEIRRKPNVAFLTRAGVYAILGDKDKAFQILEKRRKNSGGQLPAGVIIDPAFEKLRSDPRYKELLKRSGFSEQ